MDTLSPIPYYYKSSNKNLNKPNNNPQPITKASPQSNLTLPPVPKPPPVPQQTILPPVPKPPAQSSSTLPPVPKPPQFNFNPVSNISDILTNQQNPSTPKIISDDDLLPPSQKILSEAIKEKTPEKPSPATKETTEEIKAPEKFLLALNDQKIPPAESESTLQKPDMTIRSIEDYSSKIIKKANAQKSEKEEKNKIVQIAQDPDEYQSLIIKAEDNGTPPDLLERMEKIAKRIRTIEKSGTNFHIIETERHYLETLSQLPWNKETEDIHDLRRAQKLLDDSHYGMQIIKNRILEFLAVQQLSNNTSNAPVLCFLATPGTGKTTLSRGIAAALGRKFIRISLAAMGDIHQIKGRSHTSPDAEPGQIIKQICRAGVRNPVILFDEIDKMSGGIGGSEMMATFLEILDPEQNYAFTDHYIDYPYDLSRVLFLASANKIAEGEGPLINRMELITFPDYSREEKRIIGEKYILPKILKNTGLTPDRGYKVELTPETWLRLIDPFKWDSGMRTMQHNLSTIVNKMARESIETGRKEFIITPENIRNYILV